MTALSESAAVEGEKRFPRLAERYSEVVPLVMRQHYQPGLRSRP